MENIKSYQVAIIEDKDDVLSFLKEVINEHPNFECNHIYQNAEEAINFLPKTSVDIAIVDIGLPGENGITCVKKVKGLRPDILFIMYTVFDKEDQIFESLKAGASGYLLKTTNEKKIMESLLELVSGGAPMSPPIARSVTEFFFNGPPRFRQLGLLSDREKEILELLAEGNLYREIAQKLYISEGTVKQHIHKIYQKLHVQNRTQAINIYLGRKK